MDVRAFEKSLQQESAALLASAQLREVLRTRREQARDTRNLFNHAKEDLESAEQTLEDCSSWTPTGQHHIAEEEGD